MVRVRVVRSRNIRSVFGMYDCNKIITSEGRDGSGGRLSGCSEAQD